MMKAFATSLALLAFAVAARAQTEANPDSFGAKGDGKADDTAAFAQALKQIAKGGKLVLTSGKTYKVDAPIRINTGMTMTTASGKPAVVKLVLANVGTYGVIVNNAKGATISNVRFEAANDDLNTVVSISGSNGVNVSKCVVANNDKPGSGLLRVKDSSNVTVADSEFFGGYEAIAATGMNTDLTFSGNKIHDMIQHGIRVSGTETTWSERVKILNNDIRDIVRPRGATAGHCIYVQLGESVSKTAKSRHKDIDVEGNTMIGIDKAFVDGGNGDLLEYCDVDGGRVVGNTAERGGDVGLGIVRSSGILVQKNKAGYNNTNGIALWEASNCRVLDNQAYNNNQDRGRQWGSKAFKGGIRIMARVGFSENNEISGNKCWDDQLTKTQDYGIYLMKGARNTKIGRNELSGNKLGNMLDESTKF